jgi:uncharacterized membrane protein YqjE
VSSSEVVDAQKSGRSSSVIGELIGEIEQFLQTRTELFKTEIREKLPHLRNAALLALAGGLLLVTGYLLLAIAVVVLIASAFPPNLYRWFFGFLIVGIISVGFGAIAAFLAKSEFDLRAILPDRTLKVLKKGDKDWVIRETQQQK